MSDPTPRVSEQLQTPHATQPKVKRDWPLILGAGASLVTIVGFILVLPSLLAAIQGTTSRAMPISLTTPRPTPTSYYAPLPGPACDAGKAVWYNLTPTIGSVTCQPDGMLLTQRAHVDRTASVEFKLLNHVFPVAYTVSISIHHLTEEGCAELEVSPGGFVGYDIAICRSGVWKIQKVDAAGIATDLRVGSVTAADAYTLALQVDQNQYGISINTEPYITITDTAHPGTVGIVISIDTGRLGQATGPGGSAVFSDFSYGEQ